LPDLSLAVTRAPLAYQKQSLIDACGISAICRSAILNSKYEEHYRISQLRLLGKSLEIDLTGETFRRFGENFQFLTRLLRRRWIADHHPALV
jgi:hypothetical protein